MFPLVRICISIFGDAWPVFVDMILVPYDSSGMTQRSKDFERVDPSFINILNQPSAFWVGRSHDKFIYRCIILIIQHKIWAISYGKVIRMSHNDTV